MNHLIALFSKLSAFKFQHSFQCRSQWHRSIFYGLIVALSLTTTAVNAKKQAAQDSDGDGLSDQYETQLGTEAYLADTDGDGIDDGVEVGKDLNNPLDTDNDKRIDALDYDDDNDGLPTILETKADTDKDGIKNYLDSDSDNDGVSDGIEAGMLAKDENLDGIDDAFDVEHLGGVDKNGDGIQDNIKLPDINKNGIADYLDKTVAKQKPKTLMAAKPKEKPSTQVVAKLKKSNTEKQEKIVKTKPVVKPVINRYTDTDNDGLLDSQERMLGTNLFKRDSDGDTVSDAIEIGMDINNPLDSDHDGIIDALDKDDDNDGVATLDEDLNKDGSPINDDTDDDGVPNYLDGNDDGDDKSTLAEGRLKDSDNDGIPDYLDKNDHKKDKNTVAKKPADKEREKELNAKQPEVVVLFDGNAESAEETLGDHAADAESEQTSLTDIAEKSLDALSSEDDLENNDYHASKMVNTTLSKKSEEKTGLVAWFKNLF